MKYSLANSKEVLISIIDGEQVVNRELQSKLDVALNTLINIESWIGEQKLYASIYEIDEDEIGRLYCLVHEALNTIRITNE